MEAVIANLLAAFENGRMDRRQLIQSLAIAATGAHVFGSPAPLAGATGAGASAPSPAAPAFRTVSLDHISYAVSDYGRSRDFYADLMGWEVTADNGESQATLAIGDVGNIIIRNARSAPAEGPTGVINHVAYRNSNFDTDAVRTELERRGLEPRRDQGGGDGYDSYHVRDPDGWDLQISK
jgi:catechol 2,3-dioxygenase-like lactoylglutathione lyase family enzyme